MSASSVFRVDFRVARRSRILWGTTLAFVFLVATVLLTNSTSSPGARSTAMSTMVGAGMFVLPLVVMVVSYLSLAGERESGRIKYLLGLPHSRRDVLIGKFASRVAIVVASAGVALTIGAALLSLRFGSVPVEAYLKYVLATVYFAVVYVGLIVGISAAAGSRTRAMTGSVGAYFLLNVAWLIPVVDPRNVAAFLVEDLLGMSALPGLYDFVYHLSPMTAYAAIGNEIIPGITRGGFVGQYDGLPFFLEGWFMLVILAAWLIVPLVVGFGRFRNAELG